MPRRNVILALALAAVPFAARSQRTDRVRRLGVLWSGSQVNGQTIKDIAGLVEGLKALGWVEGRNLQLDLRYAEGNADRARGYATELANLAPDVIFSSGTVALNALREAKVGTPIVFANVTDPVAGGFVTSLAHPGGNVTGFTPFEYDIGGKWLQLLRDAVPGIAHVALLGEPANHNFAGFVHSFSSAAKAMKVEPIPAPIRSVGDIEQAIEAESRTPHGGLIVTASTFSVVNSDLIIALASRFRLPAIYWNSGYTQRGGLMSYGPDSGDLHRAAADYVDRILKGAKPADLPVQSPNKTNLTINLTTAKALGVTIPQSVLLQADEVFR